MLHTFIYLCIKLSFNRHSIEQQHFLHLYSYLDGYLCRECGKSFKFAKSYRQHRKVVHTNPSIHWCPKCPFTTICHDSLRRHHAHLHLRRRSAYVPRRSISTSKKKKAIDYWNNSAACTPKKRKHVEENFKLTPNGQYPISSLPKESKVYCR